MPEGETLTLLLWRREKRFFNCLIFALQEAERSYSYLNNGIGGLPDSKGMLQRFETFMHHHEDAEGMRFIRAGLSWVVDSLGIDQEDFLAEMVAGSLGCYYPEPVSMLSCCEKVVKAYLQQELMPHSETQQDFRLFATEGGTAAMSYLFQSLKANRLLKKGDAVALMTPIFTPYLEIPELEDFQHEVITIDMTEESGWQLPEESIKQLLNPDIKLLCLVNPSNPASVQLSHDSLIQLQTLVENQRPELMIVTDDVYATFAEDFISLFALCPHNTLCIYSFSKYFGATGWRMGVMALHEDSVFDRLLAENHSQERYKTLRQYKDGVAFIDRLVADSRLVALHHSAGLSTPQQLQMMLFALASLIDNRDSYKRSARRLIHSRLKRLYKSIGLPLPSSQLTVGYYTLLDLEVLGECIYGSDFAQWFVGLHSCSELLFRLADETGVVLLPAHGFDVHKPAVRVSLANLTLADYAAIGRCFRLILDKYYKEFTESEVEAN